MTAEQPLTPGFMIVHGNRLDALRELAVAWMGRYPLRPLENEVVLVHSNGVAQWLKQALAEAPGGDGGGCDRSRNAHTSAPPSSAPRISRTPSRSRWSISEVATTASTMPSPIQPLSSPLVGPRARS